MNIIRVLKDLLKRHSSIIKDCFRESETNMNPIPIKIFIKTLKLMPMQRLMIKECLKLKAEIIKPSKMMKILITQNKFHAKDPISNTKLFPIKIPS